VSLASSSSKDGPHRRETPSPPPLIAVVGCDGSGKSTVTELLRDWLARDRTVQLCHLGKQSGNVGRAIGRLPLLGGRMETTLYQKAKAADTEKGPGLPAALVIYAFTLRRARRFRRMMRLRRTGAAIIADRFPQVEAPGPMDGPGLSKARPTGLVGWLARRERCLFDAMVAQRPDLVIRLNVSLPVAMARKPDHRAASLARKIDTLPLLRFQGAPIIDIDADQPLALVVRQAQAAIARLLASRGDAAVPDPG